VHLCARICTKKHGEATLEERAVSLVRWLFSLFNVPQDAKRALEQRVAGEFSILVARHYALWKSLEESIIPAHPDHPLADCRRKVA
jgi:hypothetical protein